MLDFIITNQADLSPKSLSLVPQVLTNWFARKNVDDMIILLQY